MKKAKRNDRRHAACALVFVLIFGTAFFSGLRAERPDILLLIADDLGPQLGCYGDANAVTPELDALAADGMRFTRAHVTTASCSPSRGSMFTGLYPHQNGMYGLSQQGWSRLKDGVPILPNELADIGYRTAIIGKTHFAPEEAFHWDLRIVDPKKTVVERDVRWMNAQAERFLRESPGDSPVFLVMSYVDPHRGGGDGRYGPNRNEKFPRVRHGLPEDPPSPGQTEPIPFLAVDGADVRLENSDFYAAVSRLDTGVGEMLDIMERVRDPRNTLVVFLGDHGPDVTRGKISAYATATHIPLLVRWRGRVEGGRTSDALVSTIDLFPTMLEAAGAGQSLVDPRQTGRSLLPLLTGGTYREREYLFTEFITHVPWHYYPRHAVLSADGYQLVNNRFGGGERENPLEPHNYCFAWFRALTPEFDGTMVEAAYKAVENPPRIELFHLDNDPFLLDNLADDPAQRERVERLSGVLAKWRRETDDPFLDEVHGERFEVEVERMYEKWKSRQRR